MKNNNENEFGQKFSLYLLKNQNQDYIDIDEGLSSDSFALAWSISLTNWNLIRSNKFTNGIQNISACWTIVWKADEIIKILHMVSKDKAITSKSNWKSFL